MIKITSSLALIALLIIGIGCQPKADKKCDLLQKSENFNKVVEGKKIGLYTLQNKNNMAVQLTNYGARLVSVITPDKNNHMADITLGFTTIDEYLSESMYLGCIVGRFANRIKEGKFSLNKVDYSLFINNGVNSLHGGKYGLDKKIWQAEQSKNSVTFTYTSPDMEEGYPGNLTLKQKFTLSENNELTLEYWAETDKATPINLSNHAYWNLNGEGDKSILNHTWTILADSFTPVDSTLIPFGESKSVDNTPFDFRNETAIGKRINNKNTQLSYGGGYDHNWVLNRKTTSDLEKAATLYSPESGRAIDIFTTEPGMQFYSGNFMDGSVKGKSGKAYAYRSALVFETQHFPDSPNQPNFPNTILKPGEKYYQKTVYKFYTR